MRDTPTTEGENNQVRKADGQIDGNMKDSVVSFHRGWKVGNHGSSVFAGLLRGHLPAQLTPFHEDRCSRSAGSMMVS